MTDKTSKWADSPWPILIAVAAILIASVQVVISQQQNSHTVDCLTSYANGLNAALQPISSSSAELQAADQAWKHSMLSFLTDLTDPKATDTQKRLQLTNMTSLLKADTTTYDKVLNARQNHPYPSAPEVAC